MTIVTARETVAQSKSQGLEHINKRGYQCQTVRFGTKTVQ